VVPASTLRLVDCVEERQWIGYKWRGKCMCVCVCVCREHGWRGRMEI
jgi:hypothetical protein